MLKRLPAFVLILAVLTSCVPATPTAAPVFTATSTFETAPVNWWKDAVFYEIFVRSFYDSDGDGIGDFNGITAKLDYLNDGDSATDTDLGITGIWLMPIFPSPSYHGYDVTDYYGVNPQYGTMDDFQEFLDEAHRRGLQVITELVINHTSDQHQWFQKSRTDPRGEFGDFYVWSDTDQRYQEVRIIFIDTERSNWTWDPVRQQYFWHRFFSHQPDLNFENPKVIGALFDVVRFWLDQGIDGFRADAIPYLYEEEGTNCENLPATHEFLRRLRTMVDESYPGRVIIAEANQPPNEVVDGGGSRH